MTDPTRQCGLGRRTLCPCRSRSLPLTQYFSTEKDSATFVSSKLSLEDIEVTDPTKSTRATPAPPIRYHNPRMVEWYRRNGTPEASHPSPRWTDDSGPLRRRDRDVPCVQRGTSRSRPLCRETVHLSPRDLSIGLEGNSILDPFEDLASILRTTDTPW